MFFVWELKVYLFSTESLRKFVTGQRRGINHRFRKAAIKAPGGGVSAKGG
jgi:hypothetical protein